MMITTKTRLTFFAGGSIAIIGVVLRFESESLATQKMGPGLSTIDEAALDHLLQDARIIILFGSGLILLACHRWLWSTDTKADVGKN